MRGLIALGMSAFALLAASNAAWAQRAGENAVAAADDAFGSSVGLESTGIYSESDTRGFSPVKAGNARLDGLYYDPVGSLSARLRHGNTVRVGFSAEEYPFPAPTGIIEYRLRPFPQDAGVGASLGYNAMAFGGYIRELDLRLPLKEGRIAILAGGAMSDLRQSDGSSNEAWGLTGRVIARLGDVEIAPFVSYSRFTQNHAHPLVVVTDALPKFPKMRRYLGQDWASGHYVNHQYGGVVKAAITERVSLRGGLFHAVGDRQENYSEIFALVTPTLANHVLIADPEHALHSTSGELQIAYRLASGALQHRIIASYRARNRYTETGGSDLRNFGQVTFGELDPEQQPGFVFRPVNLGRVRQSSLMLGYSAKLDSVGKLSLGLQKARYRGQLRDGRTGLASTSRDDPWLYNAALGIDLTPAVSLFVATQKGLEDSGLAPENAANRNEQLPATRTTQYEGGIRWKFAGGQLALNAFQITKPYFSFGAGRLFTQVGMVRHRGAEISFSGHFGDRLNVLAGAVLMQPRVTGPARDAGLVGARPTGTPSAYVRIDANYRTDILGGLTPTASLIYTGKRAAGSQPLAQLGGRQLMVPGIATLDLGLRKQFRIGKVPASLRALAYNVFDAKTWKVVAANTIYMEERRRYNLTLTADF